jgi:hypothetical protein
MGNRERTPSPHLWGEVPRRGDGGTFSLKFASCETYPPSTSLRSATSPRMRGEESANQISHSFSTSARNLAVSALHYFLSVGQKIGDVSRA